MQKKQEIIQQNLEAFPMEISHLQFAWDELLTDTQKIKIVMRWELWNMIKECQRDDCIKMYACIADKYSITINHVRDEANSLRRRVLGIKKETV